MVSGRVLLGAVLVVSGLQALASPIHVAFDWPAGKPASTLAQIHISATRLAGNTDTALPVDTETTPSGAILNLRDGVWQVEASAPGYWSQQTEVTVAPQSPASVRLAMWPATSLHGEILTPGEEPLPRFLDIRLSATQDPSRPNRSEPAPSHAELRCRVDQGTWSCLGPAGLFDLRLEAAGYAPRYEWGIHLQPTGGTGLGRIELRRAASVFGRAALNDASDPPGPCRAILQADVERRGPEPDLNATPEGEKPLSVLLTRHGYFQFVGVLPGRHMLDVVCHGASAFREVLVQAEGETRIVAPVLLEELTLEIAITPAIDPQGRPWQLTVDMTSPRYRRVADKTTTSADGRWARRGLMAGNYRVTVRSADGTTWLLKYFDLGVRSRPLSLHLASVTVSGRVTLSSEPVRARLLFSNDEGGESATLRSDDNGRFQGLLPVKPGVLESSWTVEAHVAQPPVNQRLLGVHVQPAGAGAPTQLDLELPTIAVRGNVVSQNGQPQRGTQVTFLDSRGAQTTTATDNAGNFEMPDLPPGKYTAMADSPEGVSNRVPFEVAKDRESDLKLVLNSETIRFNVVSSDGPVANAAVQIWIAPGVPRTFVRTDQNGRFEVNLPPGTAEVGLIVGAQGYALKLARLPVSSEADEATDANTITLGESGGKLELNLQPPGRTLDPSASPVLVHDGVFQDARAIAGWGTDQAGKSDDGPTVIDAIEPGKYALCVVPDPTQLTALWSAPPPSDHCSTGFVHQGETLALAPPSSK